MLRVAAKQLCSILNQLHQNNQQYYSQRQRQYSDI